MRFYLAGSVFASLLSCSNSPASRLETGRDTLSLYGREYTFVPIRLARGTGNSVPKDIIFTPRDRSVLRTNGSAVACLREDTTDVEVRAEGLRTSLVVVCRFASRIAGETFLDFEPAAEPQPLVARVMFASGDSESVSAIDARTSDTSVAIISEGAVVPRAIGFAGLTVDYGGVTVRATIRVRRTVHNGSVALKPGEARRWQLDGGRYSIAVKVGSRKDLNALNMETEGLNCSRDFRDEDTIHCVAEDRGEVTLLNRESSPSAGTARAMVRILHVP